MHLLLRRMYSYTRKLLIRGAWFVVCLAAACYPVQDSSSPIPLNAGQATFTSKTPPGQVVETAAPATVPVPSTLAQIRQRGKLVVGTAITRPFEFYDPLRYELVGFDVEIAKEVARRLGVSLQWVEMPFATLLPAVVERKVDMTIAAMYITPERQQQVDFADPYVDTGLVIVVRPELSSTVHTAQDLAGRQVGVKIGATGARFAQGLVAQGIPLQIQEYKDTLVSLMDLEVGRIDAVFNDYLNTQAYMRSSHSSLHIVQDPSGGPFFISKAHLGIAVHQGETEWLVFINQVLAEMRQDGRLERLYQEWLRPAP